MHYTPLACGVLDGTDAGSVAVRYQVGVDPDVADPASATLILAKAQPCRLHFGGQVAFGPDGYLWVASGDGGYPHNFAPTESSDRAQDISHRMGKILRIDVDNGDPYAISADNPFVAVDRARPEIWAYGLHNSWRFSFDRLTGDL